MLAVTAGSVITRITATGTPLAPRGALITTAVRPRVRVVIGGVGVTGSGGGVTAITAAARR